jgi:hypothetical protein
MQRILDSITGIRDLWYPKTSGLTIIKAEISMTYENFFSESFQELNVQNGKPDEPGLG